MFEAAVFEDGRLYPCGTVPIVMGMYITISPPWSRGTSINT